MEKYIGDFLNIPTLSKLKCSWHEDSLMVSLKQFHNFMKTEHDPDCGREHPRKFNVKKELGKHSDSIKINEDTFFSISALLRYMFHHSNEYKVCKDTVKDIISGLTILAEDRNIVNNFTSRSTNEILKSRINGATFDNPDVQPLSNCYSDHDGRKTVMKKKNKPRKITQDDLPDEDNFDFLSDIVDDDSDYVYLNEYQNGSSLTVLQNGNEKKSTELHNSEVEKFLNGRYSDRQGKNHLSIKGEECMEENNGSPREEEEEEGDGLFSSITDNADSNETLGSRANSDQEYQYVLETGEVPRDEYDAYDQFGEACLTCNMCSKRFSTPGNLKTHVRTHTGEKPYYCQFCNKRFTTKGNLDVHVRTHTGERPYKCHFCDKYFSTIGNRQVHMRTHTQERPFSCNLCHKPFSTKANLSTHMKTHSGRRDHECTFCGKAYTTLANLQTHMRSHNPFLQSFLPRVESPNSSDTEQSQPPINSTMNLGINNILQNQTLLGNLNLNLFNPGLFLPMTVPLGLNSFLPPNILMNKAEGSCLDLSGKEENKSDSNKAQMSSATSVSSASSTVLEVKGEKSQKRQMDQDDNFRSKSLKQVENSPQIPNGFLPNMAFLNHMNLFNNFAFSVPSQNN